MNPRHTKWKARLQEVLGNCRPVHPDSFFAQSWPKAETLLQPQFLRVYVLGLLLIEMREKQIDWSQGKPVLILGLDIILLAWMCILQKLGIDPKEEKKKPSRRQWVDLYQSSFVGLCIMIHYWPATYEKLNSGLPSSSLWQTYFLSVKQDRSQKVQPQPGCRWSRLKRNSPAPMPKSLWTFKMLLSADLHFTHNW